MRYPFGKPQELSVGCEIGTGVVRLAQLGGPRAQGVRIAHEPIDLPSSSSDIGDWLGRVAVAISRLHGEEGFAGSELVVSVPPSLVSYRRVAIPTKSDEEIESALRVELARESNLQQSELSCDYYESEEPVEHSHRAREVVGVCAPSRPLAQLESHLRAHDLQLRAVDTPVGALARALCNAPAMGVPEQPLLVVSVGGASTQLCVVQGGAPTFVHSFGRRSPGIDDGDKNRSGIAELVAGVREIGICLHFLEERCEPASIPNRACILGVGEHRREFAQVMATQLALGISSPADVLAPTIRRTAQQLPDLSSLDEWVIPLGLSAYGIARRGEEGR